MRKRESMCRKTARSRKRRDREQERRPFLETLPRRKERRGLELMYVPIIPEGNESNRLPSWAIMDNAVAVPRRSQLLCLA